MTESPTTEVNVNPELARSFAEPIYKDALLATGETVISHADGIAEILKVVRNDPELIAAAYLFCVPAFIQNSSEVISRGFGDVVNGLVQELGKMNDLSIKASSDRERDEGAQKQTEALRKMLLAMCKDLRVVLLKLASRLQTLRWFARSKREGAAKYGEETLALYAPLANRLGIWQIKWELEDLSLRFTRPKEYQEIAKDLDESREERILFMNRSVELIKSLLKKNNIDAQVSGRPKHIYSIWKKMQRKHLRFDQLFDVRALRIIVGTVEQCYEVLSIVQENFKILSKEYDDYIANPKPNGYQSLHTVVLGREDKPVEIQIRTKAMHEFAELGVAAHWRYKEAGNSNGVSSAEEQRVAWLRQLLAWKSDVSSTPQESAEVKDDNIYCLTPQGRVVELPVGATPIDFAYLVHTQLGHRIKGARVDGAMVPLNTKLKTGQTVEIIAGKTGQPSRDWLNPELGYAASPRTRNKVRQWFNAQLAAEQIASGRDRLDKELARQGKTATKLDDLARRMGFDSVDELCIAVAKDEVSSSAIAVALQPAKKEEETEPEVVIHKEGGKAKGDILVVGVDSLLTQLARCCHPVPPDEIVGYVTKGRGVTIHRADCPNIRNMSEQDHDRLIEVSWGKDDENTAYTTEVLIVGQDGTGILRDISDVFLKAKCKVTGVSSQLVRGDLHFRFKIETKNVSVLQKTLSALRELKGVFSARRV